MNLELNTVTNEVKNELQPRVRKYQAELDSAKRGLTRLREKLISQKDNIVLGSPESVF